jgi:hypothetical protein
MRVISAFMAISMLLVPAQTAFAVCIIRGGVSTCFRDSRYPKYPNATQKRGERTAPENTEAIGETAVLEPSASDDNAWVLTPQTTDGATALNSANATLFACGSSGSC